MDHVAGTGVQLFDAVRAPDMEGVVAKRAAGRYTPEATTWVKIKNRAYSQAEGRTDFFECALDGAVAAAARARSGIRRPSLV